MQICRLQQIRAFNDELRTGLTLDGQFVLSKGVRDLGVSRLASILDAVAHFTSFDIAVDPNGEHASGILKVGETTLFFRIDYLDSKTNRVSLNPANPGVTRRILNIMLVNEC